MCFLFIKHSLTHKLTHKPTHMCVYIYACVHNYIQYNHIQYNNIYIYIYVYIKLYIYIYHKNCIYNIIIYIYIYNYIVYRFIDLCIHTHICVCTVHFGYSGHLGPPIPGHYIRLATISDLNIIE